MMQILLYTVTAILLYVVSDWILVKLEKFRGKPFAARSIVFFMIILILAIVVFEGLQQFLAAPPPEGATIEKATLAEPEHNASPALNPNE